MKVGATTKRSAPDEASLIETKRAKVGPELTNREKACVTCYQIVDKTQFVFSSANCDEEHSKDACQLCWTKHLLTLVLERANLDLPCIICGCQIKMEDFERLLEDQPKHVYHYKQRVLHKTMKERGERECLADMKDATGKLTKDAEGKTTTCRNIQVHDIATHGRVLKCTKCGNQACASCGIREHEGETCQAFDARMRVQHGHEEAKTAKLFASKRAIRRQCPYCGIMCELNHDKGPDGKKLGQGCMKVRCEATPLAKGDKLTMLGGCGMEFCLRCGAAYVGHGSVRERGNTAHSPTCSFFKKKIEDRRFAGSEHRIQRNGELADDGDEAIGGDIGTISKDVDE